MDALSVLAGIALVQWLAAASPGPTFLIVSQCAAAGARRRGLVVVAGVLLATLSWALLAACGLGVLMVRYPALHAALQWSGAAYLVWLGARLLRQAARRRHGGETPPLAAVPHGWQAVRVGFLTNMANPKSVAYYSSLFAVMIPPDPPLWLFVAAIGTAVAVSAAWWSAVALCFGWPPVRRAYQRLRRVIDALSGVVLVGLGVRLALSR